MAKYYEKIGEHKVIDGKYCFRYGASENGQVFKDGEAYDLYPDKICYVPEYAFTDWNDPRNDLGGELGGEHWDLIVAPEAIGVDIFTHNTLLKECEEFCEDVFDAEDVEYLAEEYDIKSAGDLCDRAFNMIDWQYPSTYLEEFLQTY